MADTQVAEHKGEIAVFNKSRLPYHPAFEERFAIDRGRWQVLTESIFPSARSVDSIAMALNYCKARGLDVMKRPVNIVPMWNSDLRKEVETVWPGLAEVRITAHRTGQYAGIDECVFGPDVEESFRDERGRYDGLHFAEVRGAGSIVLRGFDDDHRIDNVTFTDCFNGNDPVDSMQDIKVNDFVKNVTFSSPRRD